MARIPTGPNRRASRWPCRQATKHCLRRFQALRAIAFLDDNVGYAAGEEGLFQITADGGQTWRKIDTGSKAIYRFILPFDKDTIFLCGDSDPNAPVVKKGHTFLQFPIHYSTVSYTRDGGKTWTNVAVPTGFMLMSLARLDDATLLMIASTYDAHNDSDILIFHVGGSWTDGQNVFQGGSTRLPGEGPQVVGGSSISAHRGGRALTAMCRIDDKHYAAVGSAKAVRTGDRRKSRALMPTCTVFSTAAPFSVPTAGLRGSPAPAAKDEARSAPWPAERACRLWPWATMARSSC